MIQIESNGKLYDDIVDDWSTVRANLEKREAEYYEAFWKVLSNINGIDILDLACGTGNYTRKLKQKGANRIVGVDISSQMILQAKKMAEQNRESIEYHTGGCATFSIESTFDIVNAQFL